MRHLPHHSIGDTGKRSRQTLSLIWFLPQIAAVCIIVSWMLDAKCTKHSIRSIAANRGQLLDSDGHLPDRPSFGLQTTTAGDDHAGFCTHTYSILDWNKQQVPVCNMAICAGREQLPVLKLNSSTGTNRRWTAQDKQKYLEMAYKQNAIEGWLHGSQVDWVEDLSALQHSLGVFGTVGEIGVHHGKFFLPIVGLSVREEPAIAMDLFEQQQHNFDGSGRGSRQRLLDLLAQLNLKPRQGGSSSTTGDNVQLLAANSLSLTAANFSAMGLPAFRMLSVDGGHSMDTTMHDLMLAACLMVDGGIAILDDYGNPAWQGVTEALVHFSASQNRLKLFLIAHNKAYFITNTTHRATVMEHMRRHYNLYRCRSFHPSRRSIDGVEFCFGGPDGCVDPEGSS